MGRKCKRKSTRQSWTSENMEAAIRAYNAGPISYKKAAKLHGVPRSTLRDRLEGINACIFGSNKGFVGGFAPVFTEEKEDELCHYIINMEARLLGLTREDVRVLAFQMAERNGRPHRFNKVNQMAGKDWYYGFIERHPNLSLRKPKATSAARARGFNRVKVEGFFYALDCIFEKYNFDAGNIYNVDETAITTVQLLLLKNYRSGGKKQVGCLTSAERGELTTAAICMNAQGNFVPPMLIFPSVRWKPEL